MGGGGSYSSKSYARDIPKSSGGKGGKAEFSCKDFTEITDLMHPIEKALKNVEAGDVLQLQLAITSSRVNAINSLKEICGTIIILNLDQLITCLDKGFAFNANVLKIDGLICTVEIIAAK